MTDKIRIKAEPLGQQNIRKFARALIALAQQPEAKADDDTPADPANKTSKAAS
jgi:hypothetical protein